MQYPGQVNKIAARPAAMIITQAKACIVLICSWLENCKDKQLARAVAVASLRRTKDKV